MSVKRTMHRILNLCEAGRDKYPNLAKNLVRFLGPKGERTVEIMPFSTASGQHKLKFKFIKPSGIQYRDTKTPTPLATHLTRRDIKSITLWPGVKKERLSQMFEAIEWESTTNSQLSGRFFNFIAFEFADSTPPSTKLITAPLHRGNITSAPADKKPAKPVIEPVDYASLNKSEEFLARGKLLKQLVKHNIPPELRPEIELWIKVVKVLIELRNEEIRERGWSQENVGEYNDHYTMANLIKTFQKRLGLNVEEFEIPQYKRGAFSRLDRSHRSTLVQRSNQNKPPRAEPMDYIRERCLHLAELIDLHGFDNLPQSSKNEYYALMEMMRHMLHR